MISGHDSLETRQEIQVIQVMAWVDGHESSKRGTRQESNRSALGGERSHADLGTSGPDSEPPEIITDGLVGVRLEFSPEVQDLGYESR